jgi:hypothetical protein
VARVMRLEEEDQRMDMVRWLREGSTAQTLVCWIWALGLMDRASLFLRADRRSGERDHRALYGVVRDHGLLVGSLEPVSISSSPLGEYIFFPEFSDDFYRRSLRRSYFLLCYVDRKNTCYAFSI